MFLNDIKLVIDCEIEEIYGDGAYGTPCKLGVIVFGIGNVGMLEMLQIALFIWVIFLTAWLKWQ